MNAAKRILIAGLLGFGLMSQGHAVPVYGLTAQNTLVLFDSATPGTIASTVAISGANRLLGIDFRPVNGLLYGFSANNNLYTISTTTGVATLVGSPGPVPGQSIGFDFNPVPDRIRITTTNNTNLRINPNDGSLTATDGALAYAAGDPNFGQNPRVVGSAYTNSFAGATATTLYDIDSRLDILVTQNPPNNGTLNTVGSLGFDTGDEVGFDIFFFGNQAFASLTPSNGTVSSFYRINLTTGAATLIGGIGGGLLITDIAIAQVPEPATGALLGLGVLGMALLGRRKRR